MQIIILILVIIVATLLIIISNLKCELSDTRSEMQKTKNILHSVENENSELSHTVSTLNDQIDILNSELSVTRSKMQKTRDILHSVENKNSELSHTVSTLNDQIDSLNDELDYFKNIPDLSSDDSHPVDTASPLSPDQQAAYNIMEYSKNNILLLGRAGSGKSFLLRYFAQTTHKRILKAAPTGIAALNIDGVTLHSVFGFKNLAEKDISDISEHTVSLPGDSALVLKTIDTLLIDEVSMVRSDILEKIDLILKQVTKKDSPFGGKQIILIGDIFQLPPVTSGKTERDYLSKTYGGLFFFNSNAYKYGKFSFLELKTNHRQEQDTDFYNLLNRIRDGVPTDDDIAALNQRIVPNSDFLIRHRITTLFPTRVQVATLNSHSLANAPGNTIVTYNAIVEENASQNQTNSIQSDFPIVDKLELKVGCIVMMVHNDADKQWVNGQIGVFEGIDKGRLMIRIGSETYLVQRTTFEKKEAYVEDGKIAYRTTLKVTQFPLVLAYALTIHKSQGKTIERVACDISNCFDYGQAYVALSRCRSLDGLYLLNEVNKTKIITSPEVREFYNSQKEFDAIPNS